MGNTGKGGVVRDWQRNTDPRAPRSQITVSYETFPSVKILQQPNSYPHAVIYVFVWSQYPVWGSALPTGSRHIFVRFCTFVVCPARSVSARPQEHLHVANMGNTREMQGVVGQALEKVAN